MTTFKTGDMWSAWDTANLFLLTTNNYLKVNGELAMRRGIALEAKTRDEQIPIYFGRAVKDAYESKDGSEKQLPIGYGLIIPNLWPHRKEGLFQTKDHYSESARVEIIQLSTTMLSAWCHAFPDQEVHLNYPGIGLGNLSRDAVLPIINALPNNVNIWSK